MTSLETLVRKQGIPEYFKVTSKGKMLHFNYLTSKTLGYNSEKNYILKWQHIIIATF